MKNDKATALILCETLNIETCKLHCITATRTTHLVNRASQDQWKISYVRKTSLFSVGQPVVNVLRHEYLVLPHLLVKHL